MRNDFESNYLAHHGILGMKWGHKNGPPYPLDASDHSSSEKKAGYKKSIGGGRNEELYAKKQKVKEAQKTANKSYNEWHNKSISALSPFKEHRLNNKKRFRKALEDEKALNEAVKDYKAEKIKDKMSKEPTNSKISKEQIDSHRQKMIASANKTGDKYKAEVYKNATDSQIQRDIQNRENVKKAIIAGAAVVGISAAMYFIYRSKQIKAINAAQKVIQGKNIDVDDILKEGLNLDTANKIMNVKSRNGLLSDNAVKQISKEVMKDIDITFEKGTTFGRVDFHKEMDLKKAGNLLFISAGKADNEVYKRVLPNRTGLNEGTWNYFLEATNEIRIPSQSKTKQIIDNLYNDPSFKREVAEGWANMINKNLAGFGMHYEVEDVLTLLDTDPTVISKGSAYKAIAALGGNTKLGGQIAEAFKKEGYNAILDMHDIKDNVSKLPIINLDENNLTIAGKEEVKRLLNL